MELLTDELAKVVYDKDKGILRLNLTYYHPTIMHQFEEPFTFLIDQINQLQIKKLLITTSQTISKPSPKDYKNIMGYFYSGLGNTSLQKLARLRRDNPEYESYYGQLNQELREEMGLTFAFQNFTTVEDAENWLLSID